MGRVTPGQGVTAIVFGVLEIIMGIVMTIFGFDTAAKIKDALYSPYWAGFMYIIPGILGIVAGAKKNIGCMMTFMGLNIIACVILTIGCVITFMNVWLLLSAVISFASSILGCVSACCTPAERIGVVAQPVAMGVLAQPLQYQQAMGVVQPLQYQPAMGVLAEQPQYQPGMVVSAQPPQYQPPPAYEQPLSLTQVKD